METQTLMSAVFHHLVAAFLLFLVVFSGCLRRSPFASCNALPSSTYHSVFSPLFKALSERGGSTWTPDLKRRFKPEHRYVKYMTELYKKSKRVERSLDVDDFNTIRLIKPLEECLHQNEELSMQEISYNLSRVRNDEKVLKSVLLYSSDHGQAVSINSLCYLNIKRKENSNQCPLCPGVQHVVNFTVNAGGMRRMDWVEVDVTSVLQPLMDYQKKDMQLLINLTCTEDQVARAYEHKGYIGHTLRSPSLLLYLGGTSELFHQRSPIFSDVGQSLSFATNSLDRKMEIKPTRIIHQHKMRLRRESVNSKNDEQSKNIQQPDPLLSSASPTRDCALYDFRVRFSQLKLDHWIVFPPKYNPRYCRGICPRTMGSIYGSPIHTSVQNLINEMLDSSVPKPSCIPSHYRPLSVMIFEEDGSYVYKEFQDMIATGCTCR